MNDIRGKHLELSIDDADALYKALLSALSFDFSDYRPVTYRTVAEEGSIYDGIYRLCKQSGKQ